MFLARGEELEQDSDGSEALGQLNIGSSERNNNQGEEDSGNEEEVNGDTAGEVKDIEQQDDSGNEEGPKEYTDGENEDNELQDDMEITEGEAEENNDAIKVLLFYVEMVSPVDNSEEEDKPEEAILQLDDLRTAAPRILLKYLESRLSLQSDTSEEEDLGII